MSSANQQNKSLLRTVVNFALLAGITGSFAGACVSSSDTKGTGGSANGGDSATGTGGASNGGAGAKTGGANAGGAAAGTGGGSSVACTNTTGIVTGNLCTVNPAIFALNSTCSFGDWNMTNNVVSGGIAAWGGLTADCATTAGAMHITGSYDGYLVANTGGNAGLNTFLNVPGDAGIGCSIVNAASYSGLTIDINNVTIPSNQLIVGVNLADGNQAEVTLTLTAGQQTKQIPWGSMKKKTACGPATGSNIVTIYYVFPWLNDSATHAVDTTFTNVGFY